MNRRLGRVAYWRVRKSVWSTGSRWDAKRPSDFSSDLVTHGSALLGIIAASAKREALNLEACRDSSLNGVLGVECSNHSVPTILFNDLAQLSRVGLFHAWGKPPTRPPTDSWAVMNSRFCRTFAAIAALNREVTRR